MFQVNELSLADTDRLYSYRQESDYEISLDIKGFDYGWLLSSRKWKKGERILDVGGAYSPFPNYLTNKFGCESWVVDDFGMDVSQNFWRRNRSPQEHIAEHSETKYVLERLGDPKACSLPQGYFDVVYSASVLEHVPYELTPAVWKHMVSLLKPGGELLHAIDLPFPSNGGFRKMFQSMIFDGFPRMFSKSFRLSHFMATPKNYTRIACDALGIEVPKSLKALGVWKMVLNPEILCEPISIGWNRIEKDKMQDFHFSRIGSLLIRITKLA